MCDHISRELALIVGSASSPFLPWFQLAREHAIFSRLLPLPSCGCARFAKYDVRSEGGRSQGENDVTSGMARVEIGARAQA